VQRLHSVGLKISAKKTDIYAKEVAYCGRVFTAEGARFSPKLIASLTAMAPPTTAAQLRTYIASVNWLRSSIPRYSELVQPLQDLLTHALTLTKSSGRKPNRVTLAEAGWSELHSETFCRVNEAVAQSVTLSYPEDDKVLCVFTDASDTHWAGVVTQVAIAERSKPILEQQHSPLAFVSGAFSGSELRWPTIEKEAFAILETCLRCEHLLKRPDGFQLYTDHNNLRYILSLDPAVFSGRRQSADRVERWSIVLRGFDYNIHHIPGEDNILADLLTRWGVAQDGVSRSVEAARIVTRAQQRALDRAVGAPVDDTALTSLPTVHVADPPDVLSEALGDVSSDTEAEDQASLDDTDMPTTPIAASAGDTPVDATPVDNTFTLETMLEFDVDDAPTLDEIQRTQSELSPEVTMEHRLHVATEGELVGLLVDRNQRIFVPDDRHLRLRLCIVAHQGLGGHRGSDTTTHWLTQRFTWPDIASDIRTFCHACLHCLRTKGGKMVPRPWLHIPAASGPNEVLHFDYVYIREAENPATPVYVLIIVDGFSRFCWMTAHRAANATNVVESLIKWFSLFGVARRWVSDQGRHFMNEVMSQLRYRLGAEHRFTTAYAPWSNGLVERVGRNLRETLSALISEMQRPAESWPQILPLVNYVVNQTPSDALGGRAPLSAFIGRLPTSPLDVVFEPTTLSVDTCPLTAAQIAVKISSLETSLSENIEAIRSRKLREHPTRPGETPVDFGVGDYVMVARYNRGTRDKTAPIWNGPALVTGAENDRSFHVKDLLSGKSRVIHADYLKRYADKSLTVTPQLTKFIAAAAVDTRVRAITHHRKVGQKWELCVLWEGFDDEEFTWQELRALAEDVPELVKRYVKTIQDAPVRVELLAKLSLWRRTSPK
jgi:transposase InsO family protein